MDAISLNPGQTIRIYNYAPSPCALLACLSAPIGDFLTAAWFPPVHVRRGWLHGSHAVVTVRPPADYSRRGRDLTELVAACRTLAAGLDGTPPSESDYLTAARELGRWENVPEPYLPLHPQGFVEVGPDEPPPGWPDGLVLARDLMLAQLLRPTLAAAEVVGDDIGRYALDVLAIVANTHPGGAEVGTLAYRSHVEAAMSWRAGSTDLRGVYDDRLRADAGDFAAALADPIGTAMPAHVASLSQWRDAVWHCWGVATALTLSGQVDRDMLNEAGRLVEPPEAVRYASATAFHDQLRTDAIIDRLPYWHLAHRLVVNVVYQSLACLGLSPVARYYLCYGLAETTDRTLGRDWSARLADYASGGLIAAADGSR